MLIIEFKTRQSLTLNWFGQNEHLLLSSKTSSKMPLFWNYLTICPCFKLDFLKIEFLKIEFQWKTRFLENRVIGKKLLKKKNYMELEFHSRNSSSWNLIFIKSSFKTLAFCYLFWVKGPNVHFGQISCCSWFWICYYLHNKALFCTIILPWVRDKTKFSKSAQLY